MYEKTIKYVLFAFLAVLFCAITAITSFVVDSSFFYSSDAINVDGFDIHTNALSRKAFVATYECTEYTENMEITIPDKCKGIPVTNLGGFTGKGYPHCFTVSVDSIYDNFNDYLPDSGSVPNPNDPFIDLYSSFEEQGKCIYVDLPFVLNIGKNIKKIYSICTSEACHINDDGTMTVYRPVISEIRCDKRNKKFYSKDGKLYYKSSNKLVEDFENADEIIMGVS
ncbi:MAG: hypothetical protein IJ426_03340 [Clostridia bacterium]|nr:hypothetical protein [Clostridia bacterium]